MTTEETISSQKILETLRANLSAINATVDHQEASVVTEVGDGIAHISGLKTAMAGELLKFTSSATGHDVYGRPRTWTETRSAPSSSATSRTSRKATSAAPPAASWISPWATRCSDAS